MFGCKRNFTGFAHNVNNKVLLLLLKPLQHDRTFYFFSLNLLKRFISNTIENDRKYSSELEIQHNNNEAHKLTASHSRNFLLRINVFTFSYINLTLYMIPQII
jgi:hypothetical protein